jgi:hypothetical protein
LAGVGGGSALAWAQAAIGEAIQRRESILSGAFMAFPGKPAFLRRSQAT